MLSEQNIVFTGVHSVNACLFNLVSFLYICPYALDFHAWILTALEKH